MYKLIKYQFRISVKTFKTLFVALFILLLPIIRYVDSCYEIGIVLDKWLAFGAMIMFADIYMIEKQHETIDMFYLATRYKKTSIIIRTVECFAMILIFTLFMYAFSLLRVISIPPFNILAGIFVENMLAFSATILFWGMLAFTTVNITKNLWTGLAIPIILWFVSTSSLPIPSIINIFSYEKDFSYWYVSKLVYAVISVVLFLINLKIIEKSPYSDR